MLKTHKNEKKQKNSLTYIENITIMQIKKTFAQTFQFIRAFNTLLKETL